LDCQLSEKAQADHCDPIAEPDVGSPNTVKSYRSERGKSRFVEGDFSIRDAIACRNARH
jgi:hypothetical protein